MPSDKQSIVFIDWFRQVSPYIRSHRGKTFVICFGGEATKADENELFRELIHDIALLHSLGIRLVLVHGARPQIEARLQEAGLEPRYADDLRITDEAALPYVKEATGRVRIRIESRLSMDMANSPMQGARLRVASGNFVIARPLGVREGIDYGFTGEVRRIDSEAIQTWLDNGALVLLSSLGYSPTGECFNVSAEAVATQAAIALQADKLLLLYEGDDLQDRAGKIIRELDPPEVEHLLASSAYADEAMIRHLRQALLACRSGVARVHLLQRKLPGVLLLELFSRDGVGSMVNADAYENLRSAAIDDVGGILALIRPLEQTGILVRRSRELLEIEIDRFSVLERDNAIIGCAALYPFVDEQIGELACVAVESSYRNSGRADILLKQIESQARRQGLKRLFVLTTRTAHWFLERGFQRAQVDDLPLQRQTLYNWQRASKVFIKSL